MSEFISLYAALLVLLGMLLHCKELFTHDLISLLNLFNGIELADTWLNFFLTKCAAYLSLAGFLKAFERTNMLGAGVGALLLATHPLFSMNTSRLGIFIACTAMTWWLLALGQEKKSFFYSAIAGLWIIISSFFTSVWICILLPFCAMGMENRFESPKNRVILQTTAIGLLIVISIFIYTGGSLGNTLSFVYRQESFFAVFITSLIAAWFYPLFLLTFLICLMLCMAVQKPDLAGILYLWSFFSGMAAMGIEKISKKLPILKGIRGKILLLLVIFILTINLYHQDHFNNLLGARQRYAEQFHHRCGQPFEKKKILGKTVWGIDEENAPGECWLAFGNYHISMPARYRAEFLLISSQAEGSYIEVSQENGKKILARKDILGSAGKHGSLFFESIQVDYDTEENPYSPVEHRVHYGGKGRLYFGGVKIKPIP